jgi:type IV pilus assembly protein PilM
MRFGKKQTRKRSSAIGLDVGSEQLKAVALQRTDQGLELSQYAIAPHTANLGRADTEPQLAEALQALLSQFKMTDRCAFVAMSSPAGMVAEIEMPSQITGGEIRNHMRLSGARRLRRDIGDFYIDAAELTDLSASKGRKAGAMQVLVAGAPKREIITCRNALVAAKIRPVTIELSAITVINALQASHPALCENNVLLLLDIGARLTSLNLLQQGRPLLTRLIPFGDDQITEQIGREIRSSIDFIERQFDCEVRHGFAGGGCACDPSIVEALGEAIGMQLERWNPLEGYRTDAAGDPTALSAVAPCLGAAIGVAVATLMGEA